MKPTREKKVNGKTIEEFYWGGKHVVYVDNRLFEGDFERAVKENAPIIPTRPGVSGTPKLK